MAACEKCWRDAYNRMRCNPMKSQAEHYSDLIKEREKNPCTPEEQAGNDATYCPACNRKTIHQFIGVCMNCGYDSKPPQKQE